MLFCAKYFLTLFGKFLASSSPSQIAVSYTHLTSATGKYTDLMADQDSNNKSYMGYSIHYFIDVPVIGNFSIQPAVGLSMKGITYEYDKFTTKKMCIRART